MDEEPKEKNEVADEDLTKKSQEKSLVLNLKKVAIEDKYDSEFTLLPKILNNFLSS